MKSAIAFVALLLSIPPLLAQPPSGRGERMQPRYDALSEFMGLSASQIEGLKQTSAALREITGPLAREMFQLRKQLRQETKSDALDTEVINRLTGEMEGLKGQIQSESADSRQQARAILDSDQLAALDRLTEALSLQRSAQEATRLNLLEAPEGSQAGFGARRGGGFRHGSKGRRGPRGDDGNGGPALP